ELGRGEGAVAGGARGLLEDLGQLERALDTALRTFGHRLSGRWAGGGGVLGFGGLGLVQEEARILRAKARSEGEGDTVLSRRRRMCERSSPRSHRLDKLGGGSAR